MANTVFDLEMTNHGTIILREGERLYRIVTGNGMNSLYLISTPEAAEDDARAGMRRKFGRRGPHMIERLDDVTECI